MWSTNSSGAAPVPPSEPSTTMKSGRIPVSSIALQMAMNSAPIIKAANIPTQLGGLLNLGKRPCFGGNGHNCVPALDNENVYDRDPWERLGRRNLALESWMNFRPIMTAVTLIGMIAAATLIETAVLATPTFAQIRQKAQPDNAPARSSLFPHFSGKTATPRDTTSEQAPATTVQPPAAPAMPFAPPG